jgi:hypothetical protein
MSDEPFKRDEFLDKPGIVGARWWHEGLVHSDSVGRRAALQGLLIGGGLLAAGIIIAKSSGCGTPDTKTVSKSSLEVQKEYGWNFGARSETLTFDGLATIPFQPSLLGSLAGVLSPTRADLRPYYIPTLFQSPTAMPTSFLTDETAVFMPLQAVLRPIFTPAMALAFRRGKALASLFNSSRVTGVAVVVDLPGPEAVAFAAGAANVFDPVFAIDNWPHPRGVVPAHATLAAAAYYQPLFAKAATRTQSSPAMFVLDRSRLAPYQDETRQFDNRHLARLPPPQQLKQLGIQRILYVVPLSSNVPEMDDLNDDFVNDAAAGITVKIVGADAWSSFSSAPDDPVYYLGSASSDETFWADYPWREPPSSAMPSAITGPARNYVPVARVTPFSSTLGKGIRTTPANFGTVPVLVSAATGAVIGSILWRTTAGEAWGGGSWGRSGGGGWGG